MSSDDTYCTACEKRFRWYEAACPSCGAELVDADSVSTGSADVDPSLDPVDLFVSEDGGEADLVRAALAGEGIECAVSGPSAFVGSQTGERSVVTVLRRDVDRARDVLAELEDDDGEAPVIESRAPQEGPQPDHVTEPGLATVLLHDAETGQFVGRISDAQLDFLGEHLEEDAETQAYYVDEATIEMLADRGAGETLVALLRGALRGRDGVELRWSDEP